MRDVPNPPDPNWGVRSDLAYDRKHRSHARKLTNAQTETLDEEPSIMKSADKSGQPGPSGLLFQRIRNQNLKKYKQFHSKVKAESAHSLSLNDGVVLRKSGVAMKPKSKKPKAALPQAILPPPFPREVKERATKLQLPKNSSEPNRARIRKQ